MHVLASLIDPVDATFALAVLVLVAGTIISVAAIREGGDSKQAFSVVGVLFGLLAAGGLGALFAQQSSKTAEKAAVVAGEEAAVQVSDQVPTQLRRALGAKHAKERKKHRGGSGNHSKGGGGNNR